MLVVVCGLPATGKTTFSKALAEQSGAVHLNTDVARKTLFKEPTYSKKEKEQVYDALFEKASALLRDGHAVILDGTFYTKKLRDRARELAKEMGMPFRLIECQASAWRVNMNLQKRVRRPDHSDADKHVYEKLKKKMEPIEGPHLSVHASAFFAKEVERALAYLHEGEA